MTYEAGRFESNGHINRDEIDLIAQKLEVEEESLRVYQRDKHLSDSLRETRIELIQAEITRLTSRRAELEAETDSIPGRDK